MHYDKQARALVIPESEINRVCRNGAEIDYWNGWALNLPGPITIKAKEPNEHDPGENFSGDAEDGRNHDSRVGGGDRRPGDDGKRAG